MTKTVLGVLCLIAAVFAILSNNLVLNAYAQEIQCPVINGLSETEYSNMYSDFGDCDYELTMDFDNDGDTEDLSYVLMLGWVENDELRTSIFYEFGAKTCLEWNNERFSFLEQDESVVKSNTHYATVRITAPESISIMEYYTSEYYTFSAPSQIPSLVKDAGTNLLHELENSGLALPCEPSDFEFNIDVPVFSTVKQGDPVRIPVEVTLVKGEPKEVALSTTTWQESLGIYGWFEKSTVTPKQSTYLVVQTSCNTPPDNYQFYANGVATSGDVPASSTDMVTVTVEAVSNCVPQGGQSIGTQTTGEQNPVWQSGDIAAMSTTANQLLESGNYQDALTGYNKILESDSNNFNALFGKGVALGNLGRNEEALTAYENAIEIEPEEYGLWVNKGLVLNNLGRYAEGLSAEEKAIEIDPNSQQAWVNKGVSLENLGRYDEALAAYDKTLEINPDNELAINNKNNLLDKIQGETSGGCLIATATFGSELAPQVQFLREIRDNTVLSTASGTSFMTAFNAFYYSFSPTVADLERQNLVFKEAVKITITPLLSTLSILNYVDIDSEEKMLGYGIGLILLNVGMYFVAPVIVIYSIKKII